MAWISLIFGGLFEMVGVMMMNLVQQKGIYARCSISLLPLRLVFLARICNENIADGYVLCGLDRYRCNRWSDFGDDFLW